MMFARVGSQFALESTMFVRERISMFWTFVFPVLLIVVLGFGLQSGTMRGAESMTFLVSGIIGANLIGMAFFNIGTSLLMYKDLGMLRRLRGNGAAVPQVIAGVIMHRIVLVLIQSVVMTLCAHLIFGFELPAHALPFWLALAGCVVVFTALGLTLAMLVRSTAAANVLANIVYLPLAFLSGAYFPIDHLPFARVIHWLPSYDAIEVLRTSLAAPSMLAHQASSWLLVGWALLFLGCAFALHRRLA